MAAARVGGKISGLVATFGNPAQNQFMMDALKWLGGAGTSPPADSTQLVQFTCNGGAAQSFLLTTA